MIMKHWAKQLILFSSLFLSSMLWAGATVSSDPINISLPANGSITEINEVDGNIEIVNDGLLLFSRPMNEVGGLNIAGAENSGDINISFNGILKGSLSVEGDVRTVTCDSAFVVSGDLSVLGAENVFFNEPVRVGGTVG